MKTQVTTREECFTAARFESMRASFWKSKNASFYADKVEDAQRRANFYLHHADVLDN